MPLCRTVQQAAMRWQQMQRVGPAANGLQNPSQVEKQTITHAGVIRLCRYTDMTDEFIKKSGKPMKSIS